MSTTNNTADAVPVGLSTKVGLATTAILGVVAAVTAIVDGDHSPETIAALVTAGIVLYGVIRSRGEQASALLRRAGTAGDQDTLHPELEGLPVGPVPTHDEGTALPKGTPHGG